MHLKRVLLTGLGFVFLGLGAIGLFLPVWPTTPFILVSVACFSSAPKIKARIMKISFFREHFENYERRTGLSWKTVWMSMGWLWGMLVLSMVLLKTLWISLLLFLIGAAVTSHIAWMAKAKGKKKEAAMKSIVDKIFIKDRVAIVTGGHSGIGRGIVEALSQAGAKVVIAGRRKELGNQVASEIMRSNGVEAIFIEADVTKHDDIQNLVEQTMTRFGKIDILVNNAGICHHEDAQTVNYDNWRKVMDVNLDGLFFLSQAVGKVMIAQKSGSIINISSNADNLVMTPQTQSGYNASKGGVDMVTKCLAYEWAKYNIRVNAIAPGYIKSDIWPKGVREDGKSWTDVWLDMIPAGRFGLAEEIGALALFMASDMAPFMTGSVVLIDGGYSLT